MAKVIAVTNQKGGVGKSTTVSNLGIGLSNFGYKVLTIDLDSQGMLTINALACADTTLIPVQAAYLPVKGLEQLLKTIFKVKRQINSRLEIEGIR